MASFPVVQSTANSNSGSTTNHSVTMPTGIEAGDLLLAFFTTNSDSTVNTPAGWTKLVDQTEPTFPDIRLAVYSKRAVGGDSLTVVTNNNETSAHCVYRIYTDNEAEAAAVGAASASANPNPPPLTPTGGAQDFLWFAAFGSTGVTVSSYPSNYTDNQVSNTAGGRSIAAATRNLDASSEDPGTYTISSSNDWVAVTVAVEAQTPLSGNFPIITSDSTIFSPAIDFAGDGNFPILEMNSQVFQPTATVSNRTNWTNETEATTNWSNESEL